MTTPMKLAANPLVRRHLDRGTLVLRSVSNAGPDGAALGQNAPGQHDVERNAHNEVAVPGLEKSVEKAQGVESDTAAQNGQRGQDPKVATSSSKDDREDEHDGQQRGKVFEVV